jgi:hypothetical protein
MYTQVETLMNRYILYIVAVQLTLCVASALANSFWLQIDLKDLPYLEISEQSDSFMLHFFPNFGIMAVAWLLVLMNFIPISLIITLDFVRIVQSILI